MGVGGYVSSPPQAMALRDLWSRCQLCNHQKYIKTIFENYIENVYLKIIKNIYLARGRAL